MKKEYEIIDSKSPSVEDPTAACTYGASPAAISSHERVECDLTDGQLQTILALNDRAIANGEVYSHEEVMKRKRQHPSYPFCLELKYGFGYRAE